MLQCCSREPLLPLLQAGPSGSTQIRPGSAAAPPWPVNNVPFSNTPPPTPVPRVSSTTSRLPRAAPHQASPSRAQLPSLPRVTRRCNWGSSQSARGTFCQPGKLMQTRATRPAASIGPGNPMPTRSARRSGSSCCTASAMATLTAPGMAGWGVGTCRAASRSPSRLKRPSLMAVPPRSTPISWGIASGARGAAANTRNAGKSAAGSANGPRGQRRSAHPADHWPDTAP